MTFSSVDFFFRSFLSPRTYASFRGARQWALILLLGISLVACTPQNLEPPLSETGTSLPPEATAPLATKPAPTLVPTQQVDVTLPPTLVPSPTVTLAPTPLPDPAFTNMGIELVDNNFVSQVPLIAEAGAGWVRYNSVSWYSIEFQEGTRNWNQAAELESRAQVASEAGLNFIAIVLHAPPWAQAIPGYACGPVLQEKFEAFGSFMYDLVSRYSQPPYNIKYWELGNEPDIPPIYVNPNSRYGCWGNQDDPSYGGSYYAEMLKVVYPQIKAADPNAQVLVGGLLMDCDPSNPPLQSSGQPKDCQPSRFLEGILTNGGGDYFDGVSFHAYDYYWANGSKFLNGWQAGPTGGLPVVYYKTTFLRALLTQYGYVDKLLLNTETALLCGNDHGEALCQTEDYHQAKANYVAQTYAVARGEGLQANVWYHYQVGWRASGLVQSPSNPYPALDAYRFSASMLKDTIPLAFIHDYPNVVGYKFLKSTPEGIQEVWILWSADGLSSTIILPEPPQEMFDVLGQALSPVQSLETTTNVLYLVWNR